MLYMATAKRASTLHIILRIKLQSAHQKAKTCNHSMSAAPIDPSWVVFSIFLLITAVSLIWLFWYPVWKIKRILKQPFPDHWLSIMKKNNVIYDKLPVALQSRLRNLVQLFIHQVHFYGTEGIEMNDEIRVTIATEACILILGRTIDDYAKIKTIIVYPSAYFTQEEDEHQNSVRLGESWHNGRVLLAWNDVLNNSQSIIAGHNVTLHEFAHQLDQEDGYSDGVPPLPSGIVDTWVKAFAHRFNELTELAEKHHHSFLNPYGATNPAEFFAVTTEAFFTEPFAFEKHYPKLFELMQGFYRLDPRQWR